MEETSADASYFTRTMANSSLDSQLPLSDPGGRHTVPHNGVQLLAADNNTPVPVSEENVRYYDMSGAKYLYIFNHKRFKRHFFCFRLSDDVRPGTEEDVINLTTTFRDLYGYTVITYTDLNYRDIIRTVTDIVNQDHSQTSILCIAILTHGKNHNAVLAADRSYRLTEIEYLLQSENLVGKPKLLLVQACRGGHVDDGRRLKLKSGETIVVPKDKDFLIMHATFSDYVAFRGTNGSFLINAVCDALRENSELSYDHFMSIVNLKVAARTSYNKGINNLHNKKQIPETRVTLTKSLKFRQLPRVASRTNGSTSTSKRAPK